MQLSMRAYHFFLFKLISQNFIQLLSFYFGMYVLFVGVSSSIYRLFLILFRRPKRLDENDILMSTVYRRIIVAVFGDTVTRVVGILAVMGHI